jgi:hypothetical protein
MRPGSRVHEPPRKLAITGLGGHRLPAGGVPAGGGW